MIELLKRVFGRWHSSLKIVVFKEEKPDSLRSYRMSSFKLWQLCLGVVAAVVLLTTVIVVFTPVSNIIYNEHDVELKRRAAQIARSVQALQDSLEARNVQLSEMKRIMASGADTVLPVSKGSSSSQSKSRSSVSGKSQLFADSLNKPYPLEGQNIFSKDLINNPAFPTQAPVEGTLTRDYNPASGHYGIDIATKRGTLFRAVADGTIFSQVWTIDYGFVIYVQHNKGIITVYKHASSLTKSANYIVQRGDILGTVGNTGIISTGPHLHVEIWKNGIPQNPHMYFTNF